MVRKKTILELMQANPAVDWSIEDVKKLCNQCGIKCQPPTNGSHFKVTSKNLQPILTIPAHRPIKPIFIRHPVVFATTHLNEQEADNGKL